MGAGLSLETSMLHHLVTQTRCGFTSALVPVVLSFHKQCPHPTPSVLNCRYFNIGDFVSSLNITV